MTTLAEPTATEALEVTSTEGLLDALVQLTHRIKVAEQHNYHAGAPLREQRRMVRAEVLRRADR